MNDDIERGHTPHEEPHPRGTLTLLLIYLVVIIGLWGSVYLMLLQRG